jgi:hypothetical protein
MDRLIGVVWGDDAHRRDAAVARRRQLALTGVGAVAGLSALISAAHALAIPPFLPPDETAHVGYALNAVAGDIPPVDAMPNASRIPHMREGLSMWVTNHPPLLYLVLGVPLRLAEMAGVPLLGFYALRLAGVASVAVGYLLVGWFAVLLLPQRPGAAVVATGVAATVPYSLHVAGMVYNDGFAFAVVAALLVAAAVVLQRGVTTTRVVTLTGLAVVAANLRVVGVAAAAGCLACLVVAQLLHGRGPVVARLGRGVGLAAVSGVVTLASSAWFYVGFNLARYDSLTGAPALLELHDRAPHTGTLAERLVNPAYLRELMSQYWARVEADAVSASYLPEALLVVGRWAIGVVLAVAVLVGVWRLSRGAWRQPAGVALCWALAVGWFAVLYVAMADFVQAGGGPHLRYLWPAVGTYGGVAAAGLTAPGRRAGAVAGVAFVGLQLAAAAIVLGEVVWRPTLTAAPGEPAPDVALRALAAGTPAAAGAVLAVLAVAGLALAAVWARSVWLLLPDDDRAYLAASPSGWTVGVAGRWHVRPADVALATVAGTAAGWVAAYEHGIPVSLPLLVAGVAAGAAIASALTCRCHPAPPGSAPPGSAPPGSTPPGSAPSGAVAGTAADGGGCDQSGKPGSRGHRRRRGP